MQPTVFWGTLAAVGTAVELWALGTARNNWTLSAVARRALRCHTRAGQLATAVFVGGGAAGLVHHLNTPPTGD